MTDSARVMYAFDEFRSQSDLSWSFEDFNQYLKVNYGVEYKYRHSLSEFMNVTVIDPMLYTFFLLKWP